jgi:hypothetical protein
MPLRETLREFKLGRSILLFNSKETKEIKIKKVKEKGKEKKKNRRKELSQG